MECSIAADTHPTCLLSLDLTVQLCGTFESIDPLQVQTVYMLAGTTVVVVLTVLCTVRAG